MSNNKKLSVAEEITILIQSMTEEEKKQCLALIAGLKAGKEIERSKTA